MIESGKILIKNFDFDISIEVDYLISKEDNQQPSKNLSQCPRRDFSVPIPICIRYSYFYSIYSHNQSSHLFTAIIES